MNKIHLNLPNTQDAILTINKMGNGYITFKPLRSNVINFECTLNFNRGKYENDKSKQSNHKE